MPHINGSKSAFDRLPILVVLCLLCSSLVQGGQVLQSTKTPPLFTAIRGRRDESNSGEDVGACRQFVEGDPEKMEFYSPNYPSNYPNHSDCIAVLTAEPGYLIRLDFRDEFHLEPSEECKFDYLEVRDGAHGYSDLIGSYCGNEFPPMLTSSNRWLWLRFHSDENIEYSGFRAVYSFIQKPTSAVYIPELETCNINVTGSEGFVNRTDIDPEHVRLATTHNLPLDCIWVITVQTGWRIQLNWMKFNLDRPNDCDSNFVDVFPERTDLPSRLHNFCGSIAEIVQSPSNILHVRFVAEAKAINSTFEALFTAFRDKGKGGVCDDATEYDCEDATCISLDLKCNDRPNCRFRWDEADCENKLDAFGKIMQSQHIIIILIIFVLILAGMCFAFIFNITRKLIHDQRIIREHTKQSREGRLDQLGRKTPAGSMMITPVATIVPKMSKSSVSLESSRSRSASPVRQLQLPGLGHSHGHGLNDHKARDPARDCFVPATPTPGPGHPIGVCQKHDPGDVNLMFLRHERQRVSHEYDAGDEEEEDGLYLRDGNTPLAPEMKDCECQTRESLFHNTSEESYNLPAPTPPPPLPPMQRSYQKHGSGSGSGSGSPGKRPHEAFQTLPIKPQARANHHPPTGHNFTTFGYSTNPRCGTTSSSSNSQPKELPKFKAEAVIEMDKLSATGSGSESASGSSSGGTVADPRPFSIQSSKSAPDVIVTH
nr:PREDICTED: uncharacterized protein LOC109030773 [Bemisia tabaci]XP_018897449.1 PREDICTED: uncharacterized protein LOC109030773 [Bemisia tabaci]XP_018897450.1 PREDICTED: uncharacterized protein LOC109030773 [Bemisia tabaci]